MSTPEHGSTITTVTCSSLVTRPSDPGLLPSAHAAPFDTLATEIIQEIFAYASPYVQVPAKFDSRMKLLYEFAICSSLMLLPLFAIDYPTGYLDPTILSMVCKRWREAAAGNHSLWTTIIIRASVMGLKAWESWGFLQLCDRLERSGSQPLKILIETEPYEPDDYPYDDDPTIVSEILDRLAMHSERWNSLDLEFCFKVEFLQKLDSCPMPLLQRLALSATYNFLDAKTLRKAQIPWTQISDMTLDRFNFNTHDDFHEILSWLSVSVRALTFLDDMGRSSGIYNYNSKRRRPIYIPKLRRLSFLDVCRDILGMLICPALEHLAILDADKHEIIRFLETSSCALMDISIHTLRVPYGGRGTSEYDEILQHASLANARSILLPRVVPYRYRA